MSFHNANTFSFAHPEVPRSLNGATIWLASPDNRTLAGNVSCLFFLKCQIFEPTILEVTTLCRISGTVSAAYFGTFAGLGCLFNPHEGFRRLHPTTEVWLWSAAADSGTTDRVVYGDYVNDLDETSQLPLLESRVSFLSCLIQWALTEIAQGYRGK